MSDFKPRAVTNTTTNTIESLRNKYGPDAAIIDRGNSYEVRQRSSVSGNTLNTFTVPKTTSTSAPVFGDYFKHYVDKTEDAIGGLQGTAQQAMDSSMKGLNMMKNLLNPDGDLTYAYNKTNQYAEDAYKSAMQMNPNLAHSEYAAYDMYHASDNLMDAANELYAMSASDPNSLIGQYINSVKQIDPNRYVSMAASDTQKSFANAQGQLERSMARQGMGASAQAAALQKNWGTALASALAGAKTKARQTGISERLNALKESVGLANEMQKQAAAEKESASNMQLNTAEARAKQADALTRAGQLTQAAAEGLLTGIDSYNKAMGTHLNAVELMMNAQGALADFYATKAGFWADMVGAKGIASSYALNNGTYNRGSSTITIR